MKPRDIGATINMYVGGFYLLRGNQWWDDFYRITLMDGSTLLSSCLLLPKLIHIKAITTENTKRQKITFQEILKSYDTFSDK